MSIIKRVVLAIAICFISYAGAYAQRKADSAEKMETQKEIYKSTVDCNGNSVDLSLTILQTKKIKSSTTPTPVLVFFHGGGWKNGRPESMKTISSYFVEHGLPSIMVEYRLESEEGTTPYESLLDAKSAMRYIKANCERFNIDPDKIVTLGASAGGHLAAAVNLCHKINDPADAMVGTAEISTKSCAQVLYNPVIYNGPEKVGRLPGYANGNKKDDFRVADYWEDFSPYNNVEAGVSPSLILLGSNDQLIPTEVAYGFQGQVKEVGGRCDVIIYEGQKHSFWGYDHKENSAEYFVKTTRAVHEFLVSLGLIDSECTIDEHVKRVRPTYTF